MSNRSYASIANTANTAKVHDEQGKLVLEPTQEELIFLGFSINTLTILGDVPTQKCEDRTAYVNNILHKETLKLKTSSTSSWG